MKEHLLGCLTLVVPSTMTPDDRALWISVAWQTVANMSRAEFLDGCQRARETCRFPSEIVPTIIGNTPDGANSGRYISDSGYVYRGDETEVMRAAEHRADWATYYAAKVNARLSRPN